jgi:hypothetical protein
VILLALLAVEPLIAQLLLMMRTRPGFGILVLTRHDELMGKSGATLMAETPN